MTTLVLIRHGRSTANAEGILAGRAEGVELDAKGREQAEKLGGRLAGVRFSAVYRSPILRCEQTATLAGWPDAVVEPGLTECDYGRWTNRPLKELSQEPLWNQIQKRPSAVEFPGGESMTGMRDRLLGTVSRITQDHEENDVVALVSHGDPLKAVLSAALKQDFDDFQRIVLAPASISIIRWPANGSPSVWCINANVDLSALLEKQPEPTVGGEDIAESDQ